ncbi:hydroxymyristoyl-ACP dehydratase [Fulvimonas yonginensis]|uniref:Hydroxymyristoyl-ACP dehydratase n=1 Tax=Fulvimonas yonginensis TaxID=1495200 RepID=A0ABU8J860_9GAMM
MTTPVYRASFRFQADHPSLPGHFPGRPLVAGVLLLEQVAQALRTWRGERLAHVREAKFLAPLRPGEAAELQLTPAGAQVRFEIRREGVLLARGLVEGATHE